MSNTDLRRPALRNDLYIRSEELPGRPAVEAATAEELESHADTLVRQLLIEEKRRTMPERLPEIAPQEEVLVYDATDPAEQRESARDSIAQILKAERAGTEAPRKTRTAWRLPRLAMPALSLPKMARRKAPSEARPALRLPAWLRNYRPTRKHVTWAVIAALVLYRPLLVPLVALLLVWVVLIAYLTLGPDRWGEILGGAWLRLHARRPELAERVRLRADRFAEKFDRVLDWLPESWADRLALPDFSKTTEQGEDQPDPFDRLAAEARQA